MKTSNRNKWYREAYTDRLDLELGNPEDGETPVVEAGRGLVVSPVSWRMTSATFSPTLAGTLPLPHATV